MSFVPGLGILKGMALTFRNMLRLKPTVQYPEEVYPVAPRHRGRLLIESTLGHGATFTAGFPLAQTATGT